MARNRPGKRERLNAKRDAFQRDRAEKVAANMREAKPERPMYGAPKGFRASIASRDNLKSRSHDIGFVGPRGYHTPKDTVSKREREGGLLAPSRRDQSERQRALELAALVKIPGGDAEKD